MQKENIGQMIKRLLLQSGIIGKLIAISTGVFLLFLLLNIGEVLFTPRDVVNQPGYIGITEKIKFYFAAPGTLGELVRRPWTAFTHMFTHGGFGHYFFNMIVFYFSGKLFMQFFGERRLLTTYLLGGLFAYGFHLLTQNTIPYYLESAGGPSSVVGASGSIAAILLAVAVYQPSFKVRLFGVFQMPIIAIAALFIISNLIGIGTENNTAIMGHLGGALFGGLSVINANSPKNIMNRLDSLIFRLKLGNFSFKRKKKPKMKVYNNGKTKASTMTDDEYNQNKTAQKKRIDDILDKISKKGYEGLTKEEKDILFNESKR